METTAIWAELGKLGVVVLLMASGMRWMLVRNAKLEEARDKREREAAEKCEKANADLQQQVRQLQDEMRNESRIEKIKQLEWIHRITRAVEMMAEKMPVDSTITGKHPAMRES